MFNNDYSFLTELWDMLVIYAIDENESTTFYNFLLPSNENKYLLNKKSETEHPLLSDIAEYVFTNLLIIKEKNDFSKLNMQSFLLFFKYFKIVNNRHKRIIIIKGNFFRVSSSNVIGFDSLWEFLIQANENIMNKLAKLMLNLCINILKYDDEFTNSYWTLYFNKLFEKLNECKLKNNENGIKAILTLIKLLIQTISEGGEIPSTDDVTFDQNGVEYSFYSTVKGYKKDIRVSTEENCFSVRQKIAYYFDINIDKLSLKTVNQLIDYSYDMKIFRDTIAEYSQIEVIESDNSIMKIKENPRNIILDNSELFIVLFDLLKNSNSCNNNYNLAFIHVAWELINLIPKNKEIVEEIKQYGEPNINVENIMKLGRMGKILRFKIDI